MLWPLDFWWRRPYTLFMCLVRLISAVLVALALMLGGGLYGPQAGMGPSGDMSAAMASDEAMPDCPSCIPGDAANTVCAPPCVGLAAILPAGAAAVADPAVIDGLPVPAEPLNGAAAGPEPYPPKTAILA